MASESNSVAIVYWPEFFLKLPCPFNVASNF
jgi:hypothetical protein